MSTPGQGAPTDQTALGEADLEAHRGQPKEAPKIEAQGEGSLDNPSSDKDNWTLKSMNKEGSCKPKLAVWVRRLSSAVCYLCSQALHR